MAPMANPIHDTLALAATPERIYRVLIESDEFAAMTGAPAALGVVAGDPFSCFGGMIEGRHIELVPPQRIVQAWRVANWPPGVYSIVRFELAPNADGTLLEFTQVGFPPEHRDHLEPGWYAKYWEPLRKYVGETT